MREVDLVRRIRTLAGEGPQNNTIVQSIGDDCAVLRPRSGEDLVFTTDFAIEDRHFTLATHKPADIGHKALARSLSDLAAMGSEPLFCLISLALPARLDEKWIDGFYKGVLALASQYNVTLAGGDLSKSKKVIADVMCCGRVPQGKALLRSGAKPGDGIYVTGALGESALGFNEQRGPAWQRHLRPQPRIAAGIALRKKHVSACMDLSDGLSLDLRRMCLESGVSAELDHIPTARRATVEQALHGGEDHELLFTSKRPMPPTLAGLPITRIGVIAQGRAGEVLFQNRLLPPQGFDHFAK